MEKDDTKATSTEKLAHVYGGAAPIICRIAQDLIQNEGKSLSKLPDLPSFELFGGNGAPGNKVLVVVMGPMTHAEAGAFSTIRQ